MTDVSIAIFLDTRRALKNGTYPVKIRLTHNRKRKYLPTDYSFSPEDFEKVMAPKPRGDYKDVRMDLEGEQQRAWTIVKKMSVFTFGLFEKQFSNKSHKGDVLVACEHYIKRLTQEGRITTADPFRSTLSSLKAFTKKEILPFVNVTPDFLRDYERWMLGQKKSITTVGIYLRNLRTLFNEQISLGEFDKELYPFGKKKYVIPASRNIKKALPLSVIAKIVHYKPVSESEEKNRDLWVFSYLCHGINVKDIAHLRYKNLSGSNIIFIRAKTARTTRQNSKPIVVALEDEISAIIKKWGNKAESPDTYVFPILVDGMTPEQQTAAVKQTTKTINKYMERIRVALGVEQEITTYTARHSFATVLKRSNHSMELISEALGHTDLRTTESYLDSFEDETRRSISKSLLAFPEEQDKS